VRSITTSAHEAAGATGIRRSPRPLLGGRFINGSGALRGESANAYLDSSSLRAQRSNPSRRVKEEWIASLRSQ
jgi:hypothetical protein